jgi:anti-sigma factor RsiW
VTHDLNERHLSAELMQSFLDGEASPRDALRVREHMAACARCRSELEAWQTLFSDLGELAEVEVAPAADFRDRVIRALPEPPPRLSLAARVALGFARALGLTAPAPLAWLRGGHPGAEDIQNFLEGLLPRQSSLAIEGHLHACRACRHEVESWRELLVGVASLTSFAPSDEFQEKVMAHVRVQLAAATASPSRRERMERLWGSVSPRTRKRVAAIAGAGITPAVTLGLVLYAVFSHPLATLGNLSSFLWLEGTDLLGSAGQGLLGRLSQSSVLSPVVQAVELASASPGAAALTASGLAGLTLSAAWVLYRNVLSPNPVERSRAR